MALLEDFISSISTISYTWFILLISFLIALSLFVAIGGFKRPKHWEWGFFWRFAFWVIGFPFLFLFLNYGEAYLSKFSKNECGILIAGFRGKSLKENFGPEDIEGKIESILYNTIDKAKLHDKIKIQRTFRYFLNKKDALRWARRYNAKYVIWGRVDEEGNRFFVDVHFNSPYVVVWGHRDEPALGFIFDYGDFSLRIEKDKVIEKIEDFDEDLSFHFQSLAGVLLSMECKYKDVVNIFEQFLKQFPQTFNKPFYLAVLDVLGLSYFHLGDYQKARAKWVNLISINEAKNNFLENREKATILCYIGISYMKQDSLIEAIEYLERAVGCDTSYDKCYITLGNCHNKLKNQQKALSNYKKALALGPQEWLVYKVVASIYLRNGDFADALKIMKMADSLGLGRPQDKDIILDSLVKLIQDQFYIYCARNQLDSALILGEDSFLKDEANFWEFANALGQIYERKGNCEKAFFYFNKYIEYAQLNDGNDPKIAENLQIAKSHLKALQKKCKNIEDTSRHF